MKSDEAIGAFEAAGIMAVHWTKAKRMADAGIISCRTISGADGREFSVYSLRECKENYAGYLAERKKAGRRGRPRTGEEARADTLAALGAPGRPQIEFGDAIGCHEAAQILGVYETLIPRLARDGKILGRVVWSARGERSRLWVLSRASCEKRAALVRRLEEAGTKVGRPRASAQKNT